MRVSTVGLNPDKTPAPDIAMLKRKNVTVFRYIRTMKASMNLLFRFLKKRRYTNVTNKGGTNSKAIVSGVRSCSVISRVTPFNRQPSP